ncbi:MAG TPA: cell division protein ZapE [Chloroflexia bacterium]|nr:cell division protein ZapE [Chloroflexia bacterium]
MTTTSQSFSGEPAQLTLSQIDVAASVEQIVADFVPPPRFSHVSFDNYKPDPAYPSQMATLHHLRTYVSDLHPDDQPRARFFGRWRRQQEPEGPSGIYMDGGYGVGKTHLLASAYQVAPGPKAYLSFQELAYVIGAMGMQPSIEAFSRYRLICVDEFELDDVGNTMLAKTFITNVTRGQTHIITTSNTLPSDLGHGRFNAEDFRREIGQIAAAFEVLRIEGEDYRHRTYASSTLSQGLRSPQELRQTFKDYRPPERAKLFATFEDLTDHLSKLHPINYRRLLAPLDAVFIEGLSQMEDQNIALRFVHLIDKLYDQGIHFVASATCDLPDLFHPEYRDKGYAKKYRRCISRLHELLQEQL